MALLYLFEDRIEFYAFRKNRVIFLRDIKAAVMDDANVMSSRYPRLTLELTDETKVILAGFNVSCVDLYVGLNYLIRSKNEIE